MRKLLFAVVTIAACHRETPEQIAERVDVLAARACACSDFACADAELEQIGALVDKINTGELSSPRMRAMTAYTSAMGCWARLQPR